MTFQDESTQPFNDDLLESLEFEEVNVPPPPMGGGGLPPIRDRAIYTTKWTEDESGDAEPIKATIIFELCYGYGVSQDVVEQLKKELRVFCEITELDEEEDGMQQRVIDLSPDEDSLETAEERRAGVLNEAGPGTIVTKLTLSRDDRERLSRPYKLRIEVDPSINSNFSHGYSFPEVTALVNVNVICSAGSVDASISLGGSVTAAVGAPATLSTGVRSPDIIVTGREDGSKYRLSGSIDIP